MKGGTGSENKLEGETSKFPSDKNKDGKKKMCSSNVTFFSHKSTLNQFPCCLVKFFATLLCYFLRRLANLQILFLATG